jgi:hypothetical protein
LLPSGIAVVSSEICHSVQASLRDACSNSESFSVGCALLGSALSFFRSALGAAFRLSTVALWTSGMGALFMLVAAVLDHSRILTADDIRSGALWSIGPAAFACLAFWWSRHRKIQVDDTQPAEQTGSS